MLRSLREYLPEEYVKITYDDDSDQDFKFKEGLNENRDGLYFYRYRDVYKWIRRYFDAHIWRVRIPEDEKILKLENKLVCKKLILYDCRNLYEIDELCRLAVSICPYFMEYVRTKTPLLCEIAIKNRNNMAIRNYIKKFGLLELEEYGR